MVAVDIQTKPTLMMGKPKLLFEDEVEVFDMAPDGRRFPAFQPVDPDQAATQIHVVLNWLEELK